MVVWQARTGAATQAFQEFSSSIGEDNHFIAYDVQGSIAHVQGLLQANLLNGTEADQLIAGLTQLKQAFEDGNWSLDPALEDVHMNIEIALTNQLGEVGKKLHTGRSRNDQVATCITLYSRDHLSQLGGKLLQVSQALSTQANANLQTPWIAKTHGQPAQPATLGFLLAAHAHRFAEAAQHVFWSARQISVSPLGSGAVAGSTLPLDPAYTAQLMSLQAPKNALLATGTRDTILAVLERTSHIGLLVSSLAEDLFQLFNQGAITIDSGLTTGSSLMPQKRNPDALELVRGHARTLPSHQQAVQAICMPLGLGYMRDLQLTKPHLVQATTKAQSALEILLHAVESLVAVPVETSNTGIGATDAAEVLVAHGVAFRTAYNILAAAHKEGADTVAVIQAADVSQAAKDASIHALSGDVNLRDTLGGPAPQAVEASLQQLDVVLATLSAQYQALQTSKEAILCK